MKIYHTNTLPEHSGEEDRTVRFNNDLSSEQIVQVLDMLLENCLAEYLQNLSVETPVNQR